MARPRLLIVGNGMVGQRFVEQAVERGLHQHYAIEIIGEEPRIAYDRVHLSEYFDGKSAEDLTLCTSDFFTTHGIQLDLAHTAIALDTRIRQVTLSDGSTRSYDKLVLATGSYPFVPPIPGADHPHCFVYRTLDDLDAMTAAATSIQKRTSSPRGVVVGGGLLGLEAANALKNLGLETHVVEFASGLMAVQLDESGSQMLRRKIDAIGITTHLSRNTQQIEAVDNGLTMHFADGDTLTADLLVFSAGIRPRDELAATGGLVRGERGGIEIDDCCRTSQPDVYAIGECALWQRQIFGLVAPGYQMAAVAAAALEAELNHRALAPTECFAGADMSTNLKLLGIDVASIGDAHGHADGAQAFSLTDEANDIYKKVVVSADGRRLLGAVLVGDTEGYGMLQQFCINQMALPDNPIQLLLPDTDQALGGGAIDSLPDTAQVCSCHNVTKGALCGAIAAGATTIGQLKASTKAGTGCGGCTQLATNILNAELEQQGIAVDKSLCEHFGYTRQELYHLVRVGNIKTFSELIDKHGQGSGCDICKPVAASILATCWNDYVLTDQHAPLQDTNDRQLANMQKNGTYSVVPRIAGGEITPDKLIVLGQVAKKYDLYTKITGGQRIDLFGARSDQLPEIWRELIAAGFETGHAYGKSVRTVKSCVGSIWCRYGVLDSVGKAIEIENRYKGLRAPHKLKFAVSGCTRECAEAQSKDVGVIATEGGWNLYVCGNGGMRPRHADLLATDLDDQTLQQYIDRFLMLYVRTADRLQRTSVWLEGLDGGLDYLREVICDDSLGLAAQLEAEMAAIVASYQCEWKTTIEDPNKVKRFQSFINSSRVDESIVFVRERGQVRPASDGERTVNEAVDA